MARVKSTIIEAPPVTVTSAGEYSVEYQFHFQGDLVAVEAYKTGIPCKVYIALYESDGKRGITLPGVSDGIQSARWTGRIKTTPGKRCHAVFEGMEQGDVLSLKMMLELEE